jgi:glucan-binding YG repeat protein
VEQRNQWIADARIFKETWADDAATWYYFNEATGECAGWAMYGNDR